MRRFVTLVKRSALSFAADRCTMLAAAVAYYTIFALFPIGLVGVAVLGFFVGDLSARQQVVESIASVVTLGDQGEAALSRTLQRTSELKGVLGVFGVIAAVWSASTLFTAIRQALDEVWGITEPQPVIRAKLADLRLFAGLFTLLGAATTAGQVVLRAWELNSAWLGELNADQDAIIAIATAAASFALTVGAFLFLHRFGTRAPVTWRDVWPAALVTAIFFEFGKNVFALYISHLSGFNPLVGPLGAAILLLLFVNYASRVALFGAELAKHDKLVRCGLLPPTDPAPEGGSTPLPDLIRDAAISLWRSNEPGQPSPWGAKHKR